MTVVVLFHAAPLARDFQGSSEPPPKGYHQDDLPFLSASYKKSRYGIPPILLFLSYSITTNKKCGYDGKSSPKDRRRPEHGRRVYYG
jgi:hypothetical protein